MFKYCNLLILILIFGCKQQVNVIKTPKQIENQIFVCDTSAFFPSNYFDINKINRFQSEIDMFYMQDNETRKIENCILFTGSSTIRKWYNLDSFFYQKPVLNRGFGGSTFPELIFYADDLIFKYNPKIIFIYEGDNDQYFLTPHQILECVCYLEKIIHSELPQTELYFISAKPSPARKEKLRSTYLTNKLIEDYTKTVENTYYIDLWTPMFNEKFQIRHEIFKKDSLHLNNEGYKLWYQVINEVLD